MHIVLHSEIADQNGQFDIYDVARVSSEKMIRRHPHVFGEESVNCAEEVVGLWEEIKKKEKKNKAPSSLMDGIPCHFPALLQARAVQKKAAKCGFDWERQEQIVEKIEEELVELKHALESGDSEHVDEEIGDLLFAVVNLSRFRERATAEELLAAGVNKFKKRFSHIEKRLAESGKSFDDVTIDEMEELWREAKNK
jgi:tetrapyrrole methylase family protein/MazG family protein